VKEFYVDDEWRTVTAGNQRHVEAGRTPTHSLDEPCPTIMSSQHSPSFYNLIRNAATYKKKENQSMVIKNLLGTFEVKKDFTSVDEGVETAHGPCPPAGTRGQALLTRRSRTGP